MPKNVLLCEKKSQKGIDTGIDPWSNVPMMTNDSPVTKLPEIDRFRLTAPAWDGNGTVEFTFSRIRVAWECFASYRTEKGVTLENTATGRILAAR